MYCYSYGVINTVCCYYLHGSGSHLQNVLVKGYVALFYLVSSTMCCRTCTVNKQKKSTGFGFWGRLRSAVAVGENGCSVGSGSVSGSMATHGTELVHLDPEDPLPPLPHLARVLPACPIHALL